VVCLKGFLLPKLPIRPSKWLTVRLLTAGLLNVPKCPELSRLVTCLIPWESLI